MRCLNFKLVRFVLLFLLVFKNPVFICAQKANHFENDKISQDLFAHSFFSFSVLPYVVNKAKATALSGPYHLRTFYTKGVEAGPDYYINFNKSYRLIVGIHGGVAARNFGLFISKSDFHPNLDFDVNEIGRFTREWDFYMSVPVWIEKQWLTKSNSCWNLIAGVNIRYYPIRYYRDEQELEYPDVNGTFVNVLELDCSIGNNLLPWLNYNIGCGYSLLLQNKNYLQCNLLANFSNKKMVNGTYQINVTGKPQSTGKYSANLAYVCLSFSYIFTGANKRLRKIYEAKLKGKN